MPRKGAKRKGKSGREPENTRYDPSQAGSDSDNDNASILSDSEASSLAGSTDDQLETSQCSLEDKIVDAVEGAGQKSSQGRVNCMLALRGFLVKKYMPTFIRERYFSIMDIIEKNLKRGDGLEKATAADLIPVFCLQLGDEEALQDVSRVLKPLLLKIAMDGAPYTFPNARAKCCLALSILIFVSGGEMADAYLHMQDLESIFAGSYLKGDKSVPNLSPEIANVHVAALSAWTLLCTLLSPSDIRAFFNNKSKGFPALRHLSELFLSPHLDVRVTAGEALAVIVELGREDDHFFAKRFVDEIVERLRELVNDSHKYVAKKVRKQQRTIFRDVLAFIEEDEATEEKVRFNKELLVLDTWVKRKQYNMFCAILGPGMNIHLSENDVLRDIFEMEPPTLQLQEAACNNQMALERRYKHLMNAANDKARTIARAKYRDKRSDF